MGRAVFLAALAGVISAARGQSSSLCGRSISVANASGVFLYNPDFEDLPQAGWATTVFDTNGTVESSLWFSTGGADYANDLAIKTDACVQIATNLPTDTVRLAEDDPGDCSKTLSDGCRQALLSGMISNANLATRYGSPPPYSNLTAGVIDDICDTVFLFDDDIWPPECAQEFGYNQKTTVSNVQQNPYALTGNNNSLTTQLNCSMQDDARTFHLVQSSSSSTSSAYNSASRSVVIALSMYFTVANIDRESCCVNPTAQLLCIRPEQFSQGSRVAPALPSGTPFVYPTLINGLTIPELVGAIIGPVLFSILLTGLAYCLYQWWRRRKLRRQEQKAAGLDPTRGIKELDPNNTSMHELHPINRDVEADGAPVVEAGQGYWKWVELEPNEPPAQELEGDLANTRRGSADGKGEGEGEGEMGQRDEKTGEPRERSRSIGVESFEEDRFFDARSLEARSLDAESINAEDMTLGPHG